MIALLRGIAINRSSPPRITLYAAEKNLMSQPLSADTLCDCNGIILHCCEITPTPKLAALITDTKYRRRIEFESGQDPKSKSAGEEIAPGFLAGAKVIDSYG